MSDMVQIKKEKPSHMLSCCADGNDYPYGTHLSIDGDLIEKLDLGGLAVDDKVEIKAIGFIDNKHESSSSTGDDYKSTGIQITELKIVRKSEDDRIKTLYGG